MRFHTRSAQRLRKTRSPASTTINPMVTEKMSRRICLAPVSYCDY